MLRRSWNWRSLVCACGLVRGRVRAPQCVSWKRARSAVRRPRSTEALPSSSPRRRPAPAAAAHFLSVDVLLPDPARKWGHPCGLLSLAPFTWQDVSRGSRALTPHPSAAGCCSVVGGVCGRLFTCSATDGHLGYSCLSAVVNVNIRVQMCVWESFLLPLGV